MKVSFNGLRMSIARTYNHVASAETDEERKDAMEQLRQNLGALMACYDDSVLGDCDDLSDKIELKEVPK